MFTSFDPVEDIECSFSTNKHTRHTKVEVEMTWYICR